MLKRLSLSILILFVSFDVIAAQNDFIAHNQWMSIRDREHTGEQKLLLIKNNGQEKIYLYWMGSNAATNIQAHPNYEEVTVVKGSLYWLNADMSIQKKLKVGDYVDRKPNVPHGPFRAGANGCLMYARFHTR